MPYRGAPATRPELPIASEHVVLDVIGQDGHPGHPLSTGTLVRCHGTYVVPLGPRDTATLGVSWITPSPTMGVLDFAPWSPGNTRGKTRTMGSSPRTTFKRWMPRPWPTPSQCHGSARWGRCGLRTRRNRGIFLEDSTL